MIVIELKESYFFVCGGCDRWLIEVRAISDLWIEGAIVGLR